MDVLESETPLLAETGSRKSVLPVLHNSQPEMRLLRAGAQTDVATTFADAELAAAQDLDELALLNVTSQFGNAQAGGREWCFR